VTHACYANLFQIRRDPSLSLSSDEFRHFKNFSKMDLANLTMKEMYLKYSILLSHLINDYFLQQNIPCFVTQLPPRNEYTRQIIFLVRITEKLRGNAISQMVNVAHFNGDREPRLLLLIHMWDEILNIVPGPEWASLLILFAVTRPYLAQVALKGKMSLLKETFEHFSYIMTNPKYLTFFDSEIGLPKLPSIYRQTLVRHRDIDMTREKFGYPVKQQYNFYHLLPSGFYREDHSLEILNIRDLDFSENLKRIFSRQNLSEHDDTILTIETTTSTAETTIVPPETNPRNRTCSFIQPSSYAIVITSVIGFLIVFFITFTMAISQNRR
jgi:hypothetical protein